jgi:hypothetical protein
MIRNERIRFEAIQGVGEGETKRSKVKSREAASKATKNLFSKGYNIPL